MSISLKNIRENKKQSEDTVLPLLSGKVESICINPSEINTGIDRIEGNLTHLSIADIRKLREVDKCPVEKHIKGLGYIRSFKLKLITLNLCYMKQTHILPYKFYFNLNHSNDINIQLQDLINHFKTALDKSRIVRVDLNADFKSSIQNMLINLQVKNKQMSKEYRCTHNNIEGKSWGKDDEIIRIYTYENNEDEPITRLEVQIRNKKLPRDRSFSNILKWLKTNTFFESIQFWNINGINSTPFKKIKQLDFYRYYVKFFNLINLQTLGFTEARSRSKEPKNFMRSLRRHLKIEKSDISLMKIFRHQVTSQLGSKYE